MPRRRRKRSDWDARRTREEEGTDLDPYELTAAVCHLHGQGLTAPEIATRLNESFPGERITRETPYRCVLRAARRGWLHFEPPLEHQLAERIRKRFVLLRDTKVVHTAVADHVAECGATMLLDLVRLHAARQSRPVHVGFSGGWTMRTLARRFAILLQTPPPDLPEKIVFHALVSGFDVSEPANDPNAFFTYFVNDPAMPVETGFVGLHAPALVEAGQQQALRKLKGIKEAYDAVEQLDIVVTSASLAEDPHGMLQRYLGYSGESLANLRDAGCIGDMLWRPIGAAGEVDVQHKLCAMTIIGLEDLKGFVRQGKSVLLVAGPCGVCHTPKTEVARAILNQPQPIATHLVVDSRCARGLVH